MLANTWAVGCVCQPFFPGAPLAASTGGPAPFEPQRKPLARNPQLPGMTGNERVEVDELRNVAEDIRVYSHFRRLDWIPHTTHCPPCDCA